MVERISGLSKAGLPSQKLLGGKIGLLQVGVSGS